MAYYLEIKQGDEGPHTADTVIWCADQPFVERIMKLIEEEYPSDDEEEEEADVLETGV